MARPPTGPALVHRLDGSSAAKTKTAIILETIAGTMSIEEAAEQLGVTRAYVFVLRDQILAGAIAAAEPRTPGPKPTVPDADRDAQAAVRQLLHASEQRAKDAEIALELERCRSELALVLGPRLKKNGRKQKRSR